MSENEEPTFWERVTRPLTTNGKSITRRKRELRAQKNGGDIKALRTQKRG